MEIYMSEWIYVTLAGEDRIRVFSLNHETGALQDKGDIDVAGAPSPLAITPDLKYVFVGLRGLRQIVSFSIDRSTGALTYRSRTDLMSDPCFLATDRTGRFLLSAYYSAGKVSVHAIAEDGSIRNQPVEWLSTADNAHCIQTDRTNRFVFVPHIAGPNIILQFLFDEASGRLTPNNVPKTIPNAGEGPRHCCFHPFKDLLYFSNEQGSSVTCYRMDPHLGILEVSQTISTLPADFKGENTCAQIHITPNGRYLYVSNRGHDSIAGFAVNPRDGQLTSIEQTPTEAIPRAFGIDTGGTCLIVTGLSTGKIATYRINQETGKLIPLQVSPVGKDPMWVLAVTGVS